MKYPESMKREEALDAVKIALTDNLWDEVDFGHCRRYCQFSQQPVNREGLCEHCYNERKCCVPSCGNQYHVEGEDCCSVHELEAARDTQRTNRITTQFELVPIPCRDYDYSAWRGDAELGMKIAYGATRERAIENLKASEEEDIDANDAARIALWEAYVEADKTLPAPTLKPLQSDCWGFTDPIAQQVWGPICRSIFGGGR